MIDDRSVDGTAKVAADAGARVVSTEDVLPELRRPRRQGRRAVAVGVRGRGRLHRLVRRRHPQLRRAVRASASSGPLLTRSDVGFVKGYYDRPLDGRHGEGGRVTELVARPLLSLLFPHLSTIVQPLAGEYAGRREILEQLPFATGYGVDLALLIDISARFGIDVDRPGRPRHPHPPQPLARRAVAPGDGDHADGARRAGVSLPHGPSRPLVRPGAEPVSVARTDRPPAHRARRRTADAAPDAGGTLPPVGSSSRRSRSAPRFPLGFVVVGVLAVLGAIWLLTLRSPSLVFGVRASSLLIGVVVYAAVRLGMGPRERK